MGELLLSGKTLFQNVEQITITTWLRCLEVTCAHTHAHTPDGHIVVSLQEELPLNSRLISNIYFPTPTQERGYWLHAQTHAHAHINPVYGPLIAGIRLPLLGGFVISAVGMSWLDNKSVGVMSQGNDWTEKEMTPVSRDWLCSLLSTGRLIHTGDTVSQRNRKNDNASWIAALFARNQTILLSGV